MVAEAILAVVEAILVAIHAVTHAATHAATHAVTHAATHVAPHVVTRVATHAVETANAANQYVAVDRFTATTHVAILVVVYLVVKAMNILIFVM